MARALYLLALAALLLSGCFSRGDAIAPIVTINDPPSGAVRSVVSSRACGYAMDDQGVTSLRVGNLDLLADPIYAGDRGKRLVQFCFRIDQLSDGEFNSTIVATDGAGRSTTEHYLLQIDTVPPTLELRSVSRTPEGRLRVSGVARDNDMVRSITVAGQTVPFVATPEKDFNLDVADSAGAMIVVEDRAGNRTSQPLNP